MNSIEDDLPAWIEKAIDNWVETGTKLNIGATAREIFEAEKKLIFKFPEDFIRLYQIVNGFEDFDWNKYMFSLWRLERILKEYQEGDDPNFIGFCDFLINSHSIGFYKGEKGIFKSYDLSERITDTFESAITLINSDSKEIY